MLCTKLVDEVGHLSYDGRYAACVVTVVDRLVHRADVVVLDGENCRLKEAQERAARKAKSPTQPARKPR